MRTFAFIFATCFCVITTALISEVTEDENGATTSTSGYSVAAFEENYSVSTSEPNSEWNIISDFDLTISSDPSTNAFDSPVSLDTSTISDFYSSTSSYSKANAFDSTISSDPSTNVFDSTVSSDTSTISDFDSTASSYSKTKAFDSTVSSDTSTISDFDSTNSSYTSTISAFDSTTSTYASTNALVSTTSSYTSPEDEQCSNDPPDKLENLTASLKYYEKESYNVSATVQWTFPCQINGPRLHFQLRYVGNSFVNDDVETHTSEETIIVMEDMEMDYAFEIRDIRPAFEYIVYCNAVVLSGTTHSSGEEAAIMFRSDEGYPTAPQIQNLIEIATNSFRVLWNKPSRKNGVLQTYEVTVRSLGPMYSVPDGCYKDFITYVYTHVSEKNRDFTFVEALPYHKYEVAIRAATNAGYGASSEIVQIETQQTTPEKVQSISHKISCSHQSEQYNCILFISSITPPCNTYGDIVQYILMLNASRSNHESFWSIKKFHPDKGLKYELLAEYNYEVRVTVETENFSAVSLVEKFQSESGVPIGNSSLANEAISYGSEWASFTFDKYLFSDSNGDVLYYALIIGQMGYQEMTRWGFWDGTLESWPFPKLNLSTSYVSPYQASPPLWNPFLENKTESYTYVLGNSSCNNTSYDYCNQVLPSRTSLTIKVRGFTKIGYQDSNTITFVIVQDELNVWLLGFLFGTASTLALCAMVLVTRRRRDFSISNNQNFPETKIAADDTSRAVSVEYFPVYYDDIRQNVEKVKGEFDQLGKKTIEITLSTAVAVMPENKRKNRYVNIVPCRSSFEKMIELLTSFK